MGKQKDKVETEVFQQDFLALMYKLDDDCAFLTQTGEVMTSKNNRADSVFEPIFNGEAFNEQQ